MSVLNDPALEQLLAGLHERSDEQTTIVFGDDEARDRAGASPPTDDPARLKAFLSDKLVALDRDKAEFCYQLCRAGNARRIVEIGTSFGVSTLYLAAAVRDNIRALGGGGIVIGTEYEPRKAEAARANFAAAGLGEFIDLREGDLRRTLAGIEGQVDFMLVDIWIAMARPALELVAPHLRPGAIVICDNTEKYRSAYADYFAFINAPDQGFRTMTLPFDGGLEFSVRSPA
jgi:predicted O-methyltransferase YrrM